MVFAVSPNPVRRRVSCRHCRAVYVEDEGTPVNVHAGTGQVRLRGVRTAHIGYSQVVIVLIGLEIVNGRPQVGPGREDAPGLVILSGQRLDFFNVADEV